MRIKTPESHETYSIQAAEKITIRSGWIWATVTMDRDRGYLELTGIPKKSAELLRSSLLSALSLHRHIADLQQAFTEGMTAICGWSELIDEQTHSWGHRWWPRELTAAWQDDRPVLNDRFYAALNASDLASFIERQPVQIHQAMARWKSDLPAYSAHRNERFVPQEEARLQQFFATVESSPLTPEQVRAVVCFDNRVQVIASAGSGKTSTMMARAAYAVRKKLVAPDRILMLAFNKKAAQELHDRVRVRLGAPGERITASTFHAFGLSVIGKGTNHKPRIPVDLTEQEGRVRLQRLVDQLRDSDTAFRKRWDLFRLVFGRPLSAFDEKEELTDWDPTTKQKGLRTLNGEVVKSREELMLANWLFYNGVRYVYEQDFEHETSSPEYGQYRPDFYYPDIRAYHEHWALNSDGKPPPQFRGYLRGMEWKLGIHDQYGTDLLQTTSASVRDATAFEYLERELTARGISLDPNPYREATGPEPLKDEQLLAVVRKFQVHVKSNRLTTADLRGRASLVGGDKTRTAHFLELFFPIHDLWERELRRAGQVDFEEMINQAADLVEQGDWSSPYELVMVDEMQDSSYARSRLVQALVAPPGRYLFSVGDDWQSINGFAGSDLSVMTRFAEWFGPGETVRLQQTFRSPQSICDISSEFVSKNPEQITKTVHSTQAEYPPSIRAVAVESDDEYSSVVTDHLSNLDRAAAERGDEALVVYILGRYNRTKEKVQPALSQRWQHLKVEYSTIHSAKGKEADYVVIVDVTKGGFPSEIEDDPVLSLAMPARERFPHAEERRLFYVALTRTRRSLLGWTDRVAGGAGGAQADQERPAWLRPARALAPDLDSGLLARRVRQGRY